MAPLGETGPNSATPASATPARARSWLQVALLGTVAAGVVFALILFAYELALARVPQHRAALERLVRAQTGLDVRFTELGLRWGWYGPEAVFRHVELDEPGSAEALLRAPELVVGFDVWRTLRSGHPEAGRIELVAPEIDFSNGGPRRGVGVGLAGAAGSAPGSAWKCSTAESQSVRCRGADVAAGSGVESSALGRVAVLQRWRGGRIDIEGGTVRLPDAVGGVNPLSVQIRRATLRRSDDEWNVDGLLFLPDRVGRSAHITLDVRGDLGRASALSGSVRVEARRLLFPGSRDFLAGAPGIARYLPRGGHGDLIVNLSFAQGQVMKAHGNVHAGGLTFDAPGQGQIAAPPRPDLLVLDRLSGNWNISRRGNGWRLRVDSLDLAKGDRFASLAVDTSESSQPESPGHWIRGTLESAPLDPVLAVTRWLAPNFDLAGIHLNGTAQNLTFDWASGRPEGDRLRTSASLADVALLPRSRDYVLGGLSARIGGSESDLTIDVQSHTARLELTQSQQKPLTDVRVSSTLHVSSHPDGWKLETDSFVLEHQRASLNLSGSLEGGSAEPRILAKGTLTGADIPLVVRLLGDNTAEAFGAAASRLTAGKIQNAEFALRGPISDLPFDGRHDGFTGSLTLRDAILSGGDLWPDANGIDARVEWHGAQIQAVIEAGRAGPFQLASAKAQWGADGRSATRLTGHVNGRIEDAIAWVRSHPQLQEYAPDVGEVDAQGDASFDLNVTVPPEATAPAQLTARVSTFLDGATVEAVSGLPPLEGVTGAFVFDAGRLQRSALTASWLGGPVTLHVGERREKTTRVLAVQAQGTLNAQQVATLANAPDAADGSTDWSGELAYLQSEGSRSPRWRMRADSNLLGVVSSLPEPFAKRSVAAVPVHLEVVGANDSAQLRASFGDRMRSVLALKRKPAVGWTVDRGSVRLDSGLPVLPSEHVVLVRGRVSRLDLPAYAVAWQRLRQDALPPIRAQVVADQMLIGDHHYDEVALQAERTSAGSNLLLDSAAVAGIVRWPSPERAAHSLAVLSEPQPAELHFTRLSLPEGTLPGDGVGVIAAFAPSASLAVDDLSWRGRSLGRLTATMTSANKVVSVEGARLTNGVHDARGGLHCQTAMPTCRLTFTVESTDAAATLEDFGFTPDLAASAASLNGEVEWHPAVGQSWLAGVQGTLSMRLADGSLRKAPVADSGALRTAAVADADAMRQGDVAEGGALRPQPFALLAVPALVTALDAPGAAGSSLTKEQQPLHFDHLEADFDLNDGQATTSDLHFDGDAEILMRGRIGIVSRDYDQQVWLLRGEERLPAAVRRFGATPRVAAAWLSLRDLFSSGESQDRSRAVLRLQGSWDDPMVVTAN
ncbi:MAG: hypothetical protein JSR66_07610 [Proteobacteria bacterium]|nr:hypothetical protein [Pseudomonadota bacterium]